MAAAAAALIGLYGSSALALSLGRITVQSALGEPLRAEIDVPDINTEEAASLQVRAASPETFQAAGLEYNPAMSTLKVTLQRRPSGRAYIRISSDRAINDPFVDMILEASWASGRIVRDYTMLFDPPVTKQPPPPAPTAPQVPVAPSTSRPAPAAQAPLTLPPARPAEATRPTPRPAPPAPVAAPARPLPINGTVTVQPGDTAGKIAAATRPVNVSLDQMLVALLRANPDAFLRDNVNRIKAGAILNLPTPEQAAETPAADARQIIVAQSKDFNSYRRTLAGSAPQAQVGTADRTASGSVTAQVQDKQSAAPAPDKLTLSKGSVQGQLGEDQLAKARSAQEAASRAAEIAKNISDLSQLQASSSAAAAPPATPGPAASAPTAVVAPAIVASAAVPAPVAPAPAASAPAPVASAVVPAVPAAVPATEPGLMDELLENPLVPVGGVALIALLAGWGVYRMRERKKRNQVDSSFLESHLKPESFFGASGGQSVDTHDNAANGSALVYSHSQLDSTGDVDPVAEADVYLAYGRDLQAEEILKEALRTNPSRVAIHEKLLEIFAKRLDTKGFEDTANQAFKLTQGTGPEWAHICEMGLGIDPTNSLYQPGGQPSQPDEPASQPAAVGMAAGAALAATAAIAGQDDFRPSSAVDLDLDLDFSVDDEPASTITPARATVPESANPIADDAVSTSVDLEFDLPESTDSPAETPPARPAEDAFVHSGGIDFSLPDDDAPQLAALAGSPEAASPEESPMPDLDLDFATPDDPASAQVRQDTEELPELAAPPALPLTLDSEDFKVQAATSFGSTVPAPLSEPEPQAASNPDLGMLEFDLGSISLDLDEPAATDGDGDTVLPEELDDPLATKLALAEEFSAIGDDDGARALIEEVIAESSGDMKLKAQRALNNL